MLHSTVLKMNGQSKNMSLLLRSWNGDIHSASEILCFESKFTSAEPVELTVASPLSISDNAEACVNIWPFSFFWNSTPADLNV